MAEQFVGMAVALTLSNNAQLKGTVSKVDSTTQILHLRDVSFFPNGGMIPDYSIEASHISSLEIVPTSTAPIPPPQVPSPPAPKPTAEFHDPAILSFSRKPTSDIKDTLPIQTHPHPAPPAMIRTASAPKQIILPDLDSLSGDPNVSIPGILSHPSLLRPKPRKPTSPPSPSQLQVPNQQRQRRTPQIPNRRRRAHSKASDAGWLTDEIVGGQVDDFDFAENLGKFDKRRDWEEFRKMDTTDPTSLLVYHNRTSTAPKYTQTLSHKTNVLDDVISTDESDDEPIVARRGSRQTKRGTTSRKTSAFTTTGSLSGRNSSVGARWKVVGEDSGEVVPVSAEQMADAEKLAIDSGMSEDVLIENAARGIAEAVLTSLGAKRLDKKNHNPAPLVVVLAGNNRTGAYSLGAGRWLSLRGIRVLGVVCAGEDDELDVIRTQLKLFKNAGGRKVGPGDLQRTIAALPCPPEITLDGLFGYLHSLDDLWDDEDKVTCVQLIKWANSLRGRRISIDKPAVAKSALDDDVDIMIASEWIIEVGALKEDVIVEKGTRVFIVDLGLAKSIWKGVSIAAGGKKRKGDLGIVWGGKWAVEVELVL